MTQNQLIELFESEHVKALIERAEEHGGHLEALEFEAFVLEHDLVEEDAELLQRELEAHNIDIVQPELDADRPIAAICASGQRSAVAASLLQRLGAREVIHVVDGGVPRWKREGWPIER